MNWHSFFYGVICAGLLYMALKPEKRSLAQKKVNFLAEVFWVPRKDWIGITMILVIIVAAV